MNGNRDMLDGASPRWFLPGPDRCCGCSACFAACSTGAITMLPDAEGFLHPAIDEAKCVRCGKCENACPVLHPGSPRKPLAVYAARAKDDDLRRISSSGGVFSLLAREVFSEKGVVYGAAFEKNSHRVVHQSAENEEELDALRGSKYIQSDMGAIFRKVHTDLTAGRKVLFSGCPCQVAGLKRFLGGEYDNLLLVDVICHAVSAPLAWQKYLSCQEHKESAKIARVFSRRNCGWREFALSFEFINSSGEVYLVNPASDTYIRAFSAELFDKSCCHHCSFRCFKSGSDITLGDFWGVEAIYPDMDDGKGVSAVICSTRNGSSFLARISKSVEYRETSIKKVSRRNKSIFSDFAANRKRSMFFDRISDHNFNGLVEELTAPPWWFCALRSIKRCAISIVKQV